MLSRLLEIYRQPSKKVSRIGCENQFLKSGQIQPALYNSVIFLPVVFLFLSNIRIWSGKNKSKYSYSVNVLLKFTKQYIKTSKNHFFRFFCPHNMLYIFSFAARIRERYVFIAYIRNITFQIFNFPSYMRKSFFFLLMLKNVQKRKKCPGQFDPKKF